MSTGFEKYQFGGWTDPRTIYKDPRMPVFPTKYGDEFKYSNKWGAPLMPKVKVDAHEYTTDAKDLPIEACASMWVIKYGDGAVKATETLEQDPLLWEIGNRLWWANRLKYNDKEDTYEVID
jgi:hypothetical protein